MTLTAPNPGPKLLVGVLAFLFSMVLSDGGTRLAAEETASGPDPIQIRVASDDILVDGQDVELPDVPPNSSATSLPEALDDDDRTAAVLRVAPKVNFERFFLVLKIALEQDFSHLSLQVGDRPVIPVATASYRPSIRTLAGTCFERAETPQKRELCWKNLRGDHPLRLSLSLRTDGIQLSTVTGPSSPVDGCPEDGPTFCVDDPESVKAAIDDRARSHRIAQFYPWRRVYSALFELNAQVESMISPDSERVLLAVDADLPMGVLTGFLRANCRYSSPEYPDRASFRTASSGPCRERLFHTLRVGLLRR